MRKLKGIAMALVGFLMFAGEAYYLVLDPIIHPSPIEFIGTVTYWALAVPVTLIMLVFAILSFWVGYTIVVTPEPMRMTYDSAYEEAAGQVE